MFRELLFRFYSEVLVTEVLFILSTCFFETCFQNVAVQMINNKRLIAEDDYPSKNVEIMSQLWKQTFKNVLCSSNDILERSSWMQVIRVQVALIPEIFKIV